MRVPTPLLLGRFVSRRKRFLMDVRVDGDLVTIHCPNSGSMEGCLPENAEVLNTHRSNAIVGEALRARAVPCIAAYGTVRPEVPYGKNSRVDFLLAEPSLPDCYVEVKNTTWPGPDQALAFPDVVTERALRQRTEAHIPQQRRQAPCQSSRAEQPQDVRSPGDAHRPPRDPAAPNAASESA
jgi:sugar fermentation stimulation protein A